MQLPLQFVCPGRHCGLQFIPEQTVPVGQTFPQAPQLFLSLSSRTQVLLHDEKPGSH
jgi:hypothetical protein